MTHRSDHYSDVLDSILREQDGKYHIDFITFLQVHSSLLWVYQNMEIHLEDYKKNPNADKEKVEESERRIHILRHAYIYMREMWERYNFCERAGNDSLWAMRKFQYESEQLKKENEKLLKVINNEV